MESNPLLSQSDVERTFGGLDSRKIALALPGLPPRQQERAYESSTGRESSRVPRLESSITFQGPNFAHFTSSSTLSLSFISSSIQARLFHPSRKELRHHVSTLRFKG